MNMGEEVSHLKAHVNTFYNNGALQRASEQPHLKTNQKPSQINKKVGSQERTAASGKPGGDGLGGVPAGKAAADASAEALRRVP
ncbi:hypothetical protein [Ruegeria sp.]|uniref:hypothetical protein n=1 Tax=Ruegeria sp. TaxID=1879320 RepID=UPI003B004B48